MGRVLAVVMAAALAAAWLWFLAFGRASGLTKRLLLRFTLLAIVAGLVALGAQRGVLQQSSPGLRAAIVVAMALVTVGYLYLIRFCASCGRMVRNLKVRYCPRCGAPLPEHGMTDRRHRGG